MNGLPSVCFGVLIFMPRGLGLTKEDINKRISHRGISLTGDYLGTLRTTTFRCNLGHEWLPIEYKQFLLDIISDWY